MLSPFIFNDPTYNTGSKDVQFELNFMVTPGNQKSKYKIHLLTTKKRATYGMVQKPAIILLSSHVQLCEK